MKRHELDCFAIQTYPESKTLSEAITKYLATLDPYDSEWSDWIECYGEAKLHRYFGVDL